MNFINNKNHPTIKNTPPNGVINHIDLADTPPICIKYIEPEKNNIPMKNNRLTCALNFSEKSLNVFIKSNTNT